MIPYFVIDRITLGSITFYIWGFFVGLGFAVGYFLALWRAKKENIPPEKIFWLAVAIFFGAALGSRLAYLLQFPGELLADVSLLWQFNQGGLMLWGGILGAILFGWLYLKIVKLDFWKMADLVMPALALGIGIGRLGCFLINDHLGAPTNLPWGILWPDGISRHPVALYESLIGFGLFIIFFWLQKKYYSSSESREEGRVEKPDKKFSTSLRSARTIKEGSLFLLFFFSYSVLRFLLDFLRVSSGLLSDPRWWGLTSSQWISLMILVVLIFLSVIRRGYQMKSG